MLKVLLSFAVVCVSLLACSVSASADVSVMPVSQVREGMRGTAKSVFRGSRSEEFNVEILGVLPNWIAPGQDLIVGKLSGANAERTFVFAGMSGSPVYIDGKLVGAISYSFPFAKEPICGITPFDQMRSLVEMAPASRLTTSQTTSFALADLAADRIASAGQNPFIPSVPPVISDIAGQSMMRIATPISFAGISPQALQTIAPEFERAGFVPVAAAGGDSRIPGMKKADASTLLGGDSVVVHLSRGDIQIAAAGTVTHRDGDKIYAFGHPFFSLGSADLPMSESHVVTVVPNANNSFKLAVADALVGSMTQDRSTGIYGLLGRQPRMLPVSINLTTSRGRRETVKFETAIDELLTGLIINAGVANTLVGNERGVGDATIELNGEVRLRGRQPLVIARRFAGPQANGLAAASAAVPVAALLRAGFADADITGIELNLSVTEGSKTAVVDRVSVNRSTVSPGQTVDVSVSHRTSAGDISVIRVPVSVPIDTPAGPVTITVADGAAALQNAAITHFTPRTAAEFASTYNSLKRADRLYVILARPSAGVVVGVSEMPNLPPSVLATMNSQRNAAAAKAVATSTLSETALPPGPLVVTGNQSVTIEVVR
jgi:hypothetical protein